ncbi:DUF5956 family protein [Rhodococcus sp. BP-241]|uniref:DUF5956 family protein n=1 Tax=Rhodococcus sp. BP-241 TaxID=2739441 RepID=UPI0027E14941|nr:DUF5956 family protein [Rhodococcus sp. BP-241]
MEQGHYVALPYSAHYLMIAWVAGPGRVFRVPSSFENRVVRVTRPGSGPQASPVVEHIPFEEDDQRDIDDGINHGLGLVGIPPIPSPFDWYVRVPLSIADSKQLKDAFVSKNREDSDSGVLRAVRKIYGDLFDAPD